MRFIARVLINAVALAAAVLLVPGIDAPANIVNLLLLALLFGLLNATVRPLLKRLTCPLEILTLGLFTLVINAFILWLLSALAGVLGLSFHVAGFWPAFWGGLLITIVSVILSLFVRDGGGR